MVGQGRSGKVRPGLARCGAARSGLARQAWRGSAWLGVVGQVPARQARRGKALDVARGEVSKAVEQIKPAREAQQAVQAATGVEVPLFQAQQTLQPSTLLKQRLIPQLDAGSKKAAGN